MDWKLLRDYLILKRAKSTKNKKEIYSKDELHHKAKVAQQSLNVLINYLVYKTNLLNSIQKNLELAHLSNDFNQQANNYVTIPCDASNVQAYYDIILTSDEQREKLAFNNLELSYQKYLQYCFAVNLSKAFHQKGYKTAVDNLNLQNINQKHYPTVKIFI